MKTTYQYSIAVQINILYQHANLLHRNQTLQADAARATQQPHEIKIKLPKEIQC